MWQENPANRFTCIECDADISLLPIKTENEKLSSIRYFKICPVCKHEVDIKNEQEKFGNVHIVGMMLLKD